MSTRHLARSIVMQTLFEWDVARYAVAAQAEADATKELRIETDSKKILAKNIAEFSGGLEDVDFLEELLKGIIKKQKVLDDIIQKAAPEWPIDKISGVDRNILRIGLYELLFGDREQVPPKVAINEAIELGKSFGGDKTSKFVNGVLGTVYKEIGEPGKDQKSRRQRAEEEVDITKLPIEQKGGAVVYSRDEEGTIRLGLVHDVFGYWTLSKGSIKEGETAEEGTQREVKEEMNLDIKVLEKLGENEYIANHPEKGKIRKQVQYFLAETAYTPVTLEESGGLDDARWFTLDEIPELTMYDDIVEMITRAVKIITK